MPGSTTQPAAASSPPTRSTRRPVPAGPATRTPTPATTRCTRLDPTGLHPVTDAELQAYRDSNGIGGTFNAVVERDGQLAARTTGSTSPAAPWSSPAASSIATGVGGPVGMMLISAGADTIIQKATTGRGQLGRGRRLRRPRRGRRRRGHRRQGRATGLKASRGQRRLLRRHRRRRHQRLLLHPPPAPTVSAASSAPPQQAPVPAPSSAVQVERPAMAWQPSRAEPSTRFHLGL